jgi:deazaflavin-dependent oxidoreductase (nitroreductase family)
MAKTYTVGAWTRVINWTFRHMTELGIGASYRHILTVPGRKTGRIHSTPVDAIEHGGTRWIVAGYGPSNWVHNARMAGEVTLSRGGHSEKFAVEEVEPVEAVPVLRKYMSEIRVTRRFFDATPDSSDDAIAAELSRHPVLRLRPRTR